MYLFNLFSNLDSQGRYEYPKYGFHFSGILIFRKKFKPFFAKILAIFENFLTNVAERFNFWLGTTLKTLFFALCLPFFKVDCAEDTAEL